MSIKITTLPVSQRQQTDGEHQVMPGDTLFSIARAYLAPIAEIKKLNPGINIHYLNVGQRIRVPSLPARTQPIEQTIKTLQEEDGRQLVEIKRRVVHGETLDMIQRQYDLTLADIQKHNGNVMTLQSGQTLILRVSPNKLTGQQ
jgi:LysM repeat protein